MVGKAERGPAAIESIRKHGAAYLMAVGGAAYLVSKAIRKARVVAFADLGMEAIYEFEVEDMPVTVAVDSRGRVGARDGAARVGREDQAAQDSRSRRLMRVIGADEVRAQADLPRLIESLEQAFRSAAVIPPRQILPLPGGRGDGQFLVMPAFDPDGSAAIKLVTFLPENASRGLPTVQAAVVAFSSEGTPVAVLDGTMVTRIRTAAASALASKYLSRADSSRLTVVGTGALAPWMAAAHAVVRPIDRIDVWGRHPERVAATVTAIRKIAAPRITVRAAPTLEESVRSADIVTCATSSPTPLVSGLWLKTGAFIDLVGSFSPSTREADDDVVRRARIFVDTFEGALAEAGDIIDPIARGVISRDHVEGELADLVTGRVAGRQTAGEITLFKSVGTALEDLTAARLLLAKGS